MRCPDCKQDIGNAPSCDCGWQRHGSRTSYPYNKGCLAHGCPLSAGIVTDWHDNGAAKSGVCRFHHSAAPNDFQNITQRLRSDRVRPLARAVVRMHTMSAVEIASLPIRKFAGIDETAPEKGESKFKWAERMGHLLHAMVTDGMDEKGGSNVTPEVAQHKFHAQMANIADQILV